MGKFISAFDVVLVQFVLGAISFAALFKCNADPYLKLCIAASLLLVFANWEVSEHEQFVQRRVAERLHRTCVMLVLDRLDGKQVDLALAEESLGKSLKHETMAGGEGRWFVATWMGKFAAWVALGWLLALVLP